jgi:hypothetical protein
MFRNIVILPRYHFSITYAVPRAVCVLAKARRAILPNASLS